MSWAGCDEIAVAIENSERKIGVDWTTSAGAVGRGKRSESGAWCSLNQITMANNNF